MASEIHSDMRPQDGSEAADSYANASSIAGDVSAPLPVSISLLLERMADSLIVLSRDWRVVYANSAARRWRQQPLSPFLGKTLWEEWPVFLDAEAEGSCRRAMDEQVEVRFERRARSEQDDVWLEVNAYPAPDGLQLLMRDITERKQAEAIFQERTRLLTLSTDVGRALTVHQTPAEMLRGCAQALVKHLDAAFARVWVLDESEGVLVLQASAGTYTHLDGPHGRIPLGYLRVGRIAQEALPYWTNAVIGDPSITDQEWAIREGLTSFAGCPLIVGDRLVGVVALFARHPLTEATMQAVESVADEIAVGVERIRSEEGLRESEARKGAILEAALDSIVKMDSHGIVTEWNPAAERTFGFSRAQAIGQRMSELIIPPALRERHQQGLDHYNATGEGSILNNRIEVNALHADGGEFPVELAVVPVKLRGRTLFIAYLRDLTERERAAAQQRAFLRDVLLSVTDGHLILCHHPSELPAPLTPFGSPVPLSREGGLRDLRHLTVDAAGGMSQEGQYDLVTAASEAGMNAIVHGGGGTGAVSVGANGAVQVRVEDQGAGISMENLPWATLSRGFSTKATLGHGLKMMLETVDRLYLLTGSSGTTVVLEQELERPLPLWL